MNRHEARLEIVWTRAVDAMGEVDAAFYAGNSEPLAVAAVALRALESILILSREETVTVYREKGKRVSKGVLTGYEVPLDA